MYRKLMFLMFILVFALTSSVNAKTIIWVAQQLSANSDTSNQTAADAMEDWQEWIDKLTAAGYTVDARPGRYDALTDTLAAELNAADLVIVSRALDSSVYSTNAAEIGRWNSITTPMILSSSYLLRSQRWNWVNNGDASLPQNNGDQGCPLLKATMPSHSIFWGVSLDSSSQVQVANPAIGSGNCTFIGTNNVGNGTLIAKTVPTSLVQDLLWIAEWKKDVEFYSGSGSKAMGHRLFFTAGARETPTGGTFKEAHYNLTEEGWKLYLNAVKYMLGELIDPRFAFNPFPANGESDVAKNSVLSWKSGSLANTHNVFFGTDINDVNNATIGNSLGVTVSAGQPLDVNYFNPSSLEFGKTYYWRVDEVNAPSKPGTFKGQVWQFTVEPAALKVPAANIKATAKHSASNNDPNNTINEKGFKDANNPDWHDISLGMWLSGKTDVNNPVWIMYEFSELYKIHEMFVWNHNAKIGTGKSGFKSTIIEYSEDGQAWTQLTTTQFNRGPGRIDYVYNTTVPFNGAVAKYVRITALSNWNGDQNGSGLSEVRFTYIPVRARKPSPDTGSVNVPLNKVLTWRAGRDALTHNVYISTNEQAVTSRSSGVHTVSQASYTPSSLELNRTYYWRVDEVNTLEVPSLWETDVWSFSTPAYILVEGFETGYDDSDANAVWATWTGWEDLTNGGAMGNPGIPYLSTTNHSGGHSSPMFYNNGKPGVVKSEVIAQAANLPIGTTNWTLGNPDTLVIWFRGDPNNPVTDKMYVKLNSTKINYNGGVSDITRTAWTKWEVPLTGINLGNISSIAIGLEKIGSTGGSGVLYLDDIQLTISVPASDPGTANLVAKYNMENNVQDSSGHNLNGTLKGTVNGGPTYQAGIYGQALVFDGNDDCVDLGKNAAFNPTGSFSVSLWAKITTWSSAWGYVMVGNRGEDNVGWQIRRYSDNRFSFTTRGISNDDMNSSANAPLNEWVNITCVYDSAARTKSIYINGALERSVNMTGTVTQIPATTHNTYIGARANSANTGQEGFFAGMLDKIHIYDKALSEGEVEYIYKN